MTLDLIVDRITSLVTAAPFSLTPAESWASFDLQPTTNIDAVFRIPPPSSQSVHGRYDFVEDRRDSLQFWLARKRNGDYNAVRGQLLRDVHSLTAAVVRDGCVTSGDYYVADGGRGHTISEDAGREYVTLRLTLPIHYEAQL